LSFLRAEKSHVAVLFQGIAAQQKMIANAPKITRARDCRDRTVNGGNFIRLIRAVFVQFADEKIDFGSLEAGDRDIKI
jgi:hypothetical protein